MYFSTRLVSYFKVMRVTLQSQIIFKKNMVQRLIYDTKTVSDDLMKKTFPTAGICVDVGSFIYGRRDSNLSFNGECFERKITDQGKCSRKTSDLDWPTRGREHGTKDGRMWSFASVLALSLFSTKEEDKEEEKKESELIIMIKRGILALKNGELKKAEQLLHLALKIAQETENEQAVTYIFDLLANLAYQRDEYPKAERLFKDVLQRLLSGGMPEDDNAVVEISLKLASVYASMSDYQKAVQGFQFCIITQENKITQHGEKNLDEDTLLLWAMAMDWYARFLLNLHKYELAKKHFIKAYEMSLRVQGSSHSQTAVLLNDIGSVCSLQKNYTEAVEYLEKAIAAARESNSPDIGSFYVNLGTVYLQQGMSGEAQRCCREGLLLSKKMKNKDGIEEAEICLSEIKKMSKEK